MIEMRVAVSTSRDNDETTAISFGPFRLLPRQRLLERGGAPLQLGGRALDILMVLVERAGEVVSKRDLMARVWPDVIVEEGSLRFHVAALRKALGDGQHGMRYLTNVPGRGYALVTPILRSKPVRDAGDNATMPRQPRYTRTLPARLARMVGREDSVREIAESLLARRFVTIVGPGGIGKTTVAVAVGHELLATFGDAVRFFDLGSLNDASLVPSVVASTLGLTVYSGDPLPSVLAQLKDKRMVLVFDSCEHVIENLARLAERIFNEAPQIHILATSRESLRVEGEHIHRLFPLGCPPPDAGLSPMEVLSFPAAQLFVERVAAASNGYELSDVNAPLVATICVKLDGIALAIELAAARVNAYGIQGVAAFLDRRFELAWHGKRTALPRHQTLKAMLDWSYDVLPAVEARVLRRLAVLAGPFTLEEAETIVSADDTNGPHILEAIANLVEKSLLLVEGGPSSLRYRLLDTTRAYLVDKLSESGETRVNI